MGQEFELNGHKKKQWFSTELREHIHSMNDIATRKKNSICQQTNSRVSFILGFGIDAEVMNASLQQIVIAS